MMFSSVFQSRCFFLAKREMDRWSDRQMDDWTGRQIDGCGKVGGREDKGGRRRRGGGGGVEVVRGTISTSCVFWQSRTLHIPVWLMYNLLLNHHTFISLYACCKHTHTPVHTHTNLREVNIISTQDWLPIDYFDVWRCVDLELQLVVCSATLTISFSLPSHRLKLMQFLSSSFSWVFMCVLWFFFSCQLMPCFPVPCTIEELWYFFQLLRQAQSLPVVLLCQKTSCFQQLLKLSNSKDCEQLVPLATSWRRQDFLTP